LHRRTTGDNAAGQNICAQAGPAHELLDDSACRNSLAGEHFAKTQARFAQLDAQHSHGTDHELLPNELIQSNPARDEIAVGHPKVVATALRFQKGFDFLSLDQSHVLTGFVVPPEIAITPNAGARNQLD